MVKEKGNVDKKKVLKAVGIGAAVAAVAGAVGLKVAKDAKKKKEINK